LFFYGMYVVPIFKRLEDIGRCVKLLFAHSDHSLSLYLRLHGCGRLLQSKRGGRPE
jgi:hypothetical protein